ncbi:glycine receptor subunit alpha-4 isoform X1 [Schistocerca gregaria]|uniref:glycine receptor subunit alpha-4 isoform X1 n=2 Tax=Schistocerca gregaria TaxID=7010 RepID=UPI00211E7449|nr:glycine receptor subunit alpha-4 isoform X1 [Schistocerca gregaria]XP_049837432.1 glycine receptor subunit alpha-4 isoform X1 [Schistocerca gregaria]
MTASCTALAILLFALLAMCVRCTGGVKNYTIKPRVVLPEDYVKEIRPPSRKGQPVSVEFSIYVVDINSINVEDMDFRVDMFVRQKWTESRLDMPNALFEEGDDYVTLPPEFVDNLWQPDPYILNAKVSEIAKLTHEFSSVTLFRNKTVRYAARMHAIIACQMEFQLYPMDIQVCPMYIESFSYNMQKLRLRWADSDPIMLNPELKLLQYNVGQPLQIEETDGYVPEREANFSRLVLYFRFERQIGHHLIQTFAPSSLVVMLSWFSFWIGLDAIPGRVTLLVTSMLTLVTMFTGLKSDIPPVAYVKALDLWMAGCMVFVFAALGEFVVVKVLEVRYQREKSHRGVNLPRLLPMRIQAMEKSPCMSAWDVESGSGGQQSGQQAQTSSAAASRRSSVGSVLRMRGRPLLQTSWRDHTTGREKVLWREIDRHSRTIFPAFFLLFVVFYWPILLLKKS